MFKKYIKVVFYTLKTIIFTFFTQLNIQYKIKHDIQNFKIIL